MAKKRKKRPLSFLKKDLAKLKALIAKRKKR
jgi:hypothetical protein